MDLHSEFSKESGADIMAVVRWLRQGEAAYMRSRRRYK